MRNLKKVLALVLVLALSLTMFAGAIETVFPFDDVDKLTAEQLDALRLLYPLGIIKGDGTSADPNGTYTRAQLAATLYRLYTGDAAEEKISTYSSTSPYFSDVDGDWYTPYINWAYIKGVILGYGDTRFGPNDPVTGVQAAAMLARLLGYEVEGEGWDLTARRIAVENRLDAGVENKDLYGTNLTRGDMFVMVANTLNTAKIGADETLAEEVFDLEIIEGAVLLSTEKYIKGPHDETIFSFQDQFGKTLMFITNLLKVNEKAELSEIGRKYKIYVSKSETYNGYRTLYAAYEWDEGDFYHVVEGFVNDGKLILDRTKKDCLYNQLSLFAVTYVNGVPTIPNRDAAYDAFIAAYNLKNYAKYRLIDNDGDGLYEFLFIEKLMLSEMDCKVELLSVTAHNTKDNTYTLSDGKTYELGQYWADKYAEVLDANMRLVGYSYPAVSSVLFRFTLVGDYIMKVEVDEKTQWSGQYVLSMGYTGGYADTYKGMQYINFLTENNEHMYAYVSKVNDVDVRRVGNTYTNPYTFFNPYYSLYYVNAYGDDTVELYTPSYASATTSYRTYNKLDELVDIDWWAGRHVGDVVRSRNVDNGVSFALYGGFGGTLSVVTDLNGYNPTKQYYIATPNLGGQTVVGLPGTYFITGVYYPFFGEAEYKAQILAQNYGGTNTTAKGQYLVTSDNNKIAPIMLLSVDVYYNFGVKDYQIFKRYGNWYEQKYADLPAEYLDGSYVYDPANYTVFFTSSIGTTEVEYDAATNSWYQVGTDREYILSETNPADVDTAVQNAITALCARFAANTATSPAGQFAFSYAAQLDMTHGVVFAYSRPVNTPTAVYTWKAFHAEDLEGAKLMTFGGADPYDDFNFVAGSVTPFDLGLFDVDLGAMPPVYDEAFTTIDPLDNAKVYVKAAKVTVAAQNNDVITIDKWAVENSKCFIWGDVKGEFNANGFTVQALLPNGAVEEVFVPYSAGFIEYGTAGMLDRGTGAFGGVNFQALYGSFVYAVLDKDGNVTRIEYIAHLADFALDGILNNLVGYSGIKLSKEGVVTYIDNRDITYVSQLDLEKTYFVEYNAATKEIKVVSAAVFAADHANGQYFELYTSKAFGFSVVIDSNVPSQIAAKLAGKNIPDLVATPGYVYNYIANNYPGIYTRSARVGAYPEPSFAD